MCRGYQGSQKQDAAAHWSAPALLPAGWQEVALQFKGITVEGFHNTSDRDAEVGGGGKALGAKRPS